MYALKIVGQPVTQSKHSSRFRSPCHQLEDLACRTTIPAVPNTALILTRHIMSAKSHLATAHKDLNATIEAVYTIGRAIDSRSLDQTRSTYQSPDSLERPSDPSHGLRQHIRPVLDHETYMTFQHEHKHALTASSHHWEDVTWDSIHIGDVYRYDEGHVRSLGKFDRNDGLLGDEEKVVQYMKRNEVGTHVEKGGVGMVILSDGER
jgi:hypothetical protein